jgi:hypothetical protein
MSNVQTYVITKAGPKHFRWEDRNGRPATKTVHQPKKKLGIGLDGKPAMVESDYHEPLPGLTLVGYAKGVPGLKDQIKCDAKEAAFLKHLGLVTLVQHRAQQEIEAAAKKASDAPPSTGKTEGDDERVKVPDDWHTLSADKRKELAEKITGTEVSRAKEADAIIEAYLEDQSSGDETDAD